MLVLCSNSFWEVKGYVVWLKIVSKDFGFAFWWLFWTVVLENTLESPLDCKEIQSVSAKGNKSWIFIGRTDAEAETPILWPPDVKNWLIWKDPDAGKDWRQEEKGTTEDEMWMASPTQWTWVWVNSGSWWWTGRSGMLRFMGSQRVRHDWATELLVALFLCKDFQDPKYMLPLLLHFPQNCLV